ncbi:MAG: 5-methyltetrahydropteroyltriglutamate--homocysteine methyltransferase, partial [Candidatus Bathyarchaeia archaeon]
LERALDVKGVIRQIHIHAPTRITDLLEARNLDVISIEAAASPRNIEYISREMLEKADKNIRVGVSRTDINNIMAELYGRGVVKPQIEQFVEDEEVIMKRFLKAKMRFGERLTFTGPDCGLGGWPSQEVAELLLKRTVRAVRKALDHEDVI